MKSAYLEQDGVLIALHSLHGLSGTLAVFLTHHLTSHSCPVLFLADVHV